MKIIKLLALAVLCLVPPSIFAQTQTAVSGTITDPSGIPYANGTYSIQLIPSGTNPSVGGAAIQGAFNGALNASGSFSASLWPNGSITPASTQWQFTICSNPGGIQPPLGTGTQCTPPTAITISGTAQVLSTTLSNVAPSLTHFAGGGAIGTVTSVSCGNLPNVFTCAVATPSTTPAISFTAAAAGPVLDCSQQPGADMGAQLNACIAALPASGGIADATKFSSPQTLSTAVVMNKPGAIEFCGTAISQSGNISLTVANAAIQGCPNQPATFTKTANIDQITVNAASQSVSYITLKGASASFTGNGIVNTLSANFLSITNNTITDEAGDAIQLNNSFYGQIAFNNLNGYVTHAIHGVGGSGGFIYTISHNQIQDTAAATGSAVELTLTAFVTENYITNSHGFAGIHNTLTNSNSDIYANNRLDVTGATAISVGSFALISKNIIFESGNFPAIIGGLRVESNAIFQSGATTGSDVIQNSLNSAVIKGNFIAFDNVTTTGFCAINLIGGVNQDYVANNAVQFSINGAGVTAYGVCLTPSAASTAQFNIVENNEIRANGGGGTNSAAIFFNNAAGATTASLNIFRSNICSGISYCVKRTDASNFVNYYENNAGGVATALFFAGGSTNDVVIQSLGTTGAGMTVATLPTAGDGSEIYTTDAMCGSVATSTGTGCILFHINGQWTGNQAIVGSDTHTAVITGNYGPVTLVASTAPTGSYLVTIYAEVSTGVATSTITTSIAYHDDTGANTQSGALFSGAVTGTIQSLTFPVRFVTGTALTYSTSTANSPQYKIFARVEAQ